MAGHRPQQQGGVAHAAAETVAGGGEDHRHRPAGQAAPRTTLESWGRVRAGGCIADFRRAEDRAGIRGLRPGAAHGYDLVKGLEQQKLAVQSGFWPLFRYNPDLVEEGKNPLLIDSKKPTISFSDYAYNETRYRMLLQSDEKRAEMLMKLAEEDVDSRWELYQQMAAMHYNNKNGKD